MARSNAESIMMSLGGLVVMLATCGTIVYANNAAEVMPKVHEASAGLIHLNKVKARHARDADATESKSEATSSADAIPSAVSTIFTTTAVVSAPVPLNTAPPASIEVAPPTSANGAIKSGPLHEITYTELGPGATYALTHKTTSQYTFTEDYQDRAGKPHS